MQDWVSQLDEVTQLVPTFRDAAEVQNSEKRQYQNSRCSRDRQKDIRLTEGGLCQKKNNNNREVTGPSVRQDDNGQLLKALF